MGEELEAMKKKFENKKAEAKRKEKEIKRLKGVIEELRKEAVVKDARIKELEEPPQRTKSARKEDKEEIIERVELEEKTRKRLRTEEMMVALPMMQMFGDSNFFKTMMNNNN